MTCPKCSATLIEGATFCHMCGEHVPTQTAAPAAANEPVVQSPYTAQPHSTPASNSNRPEAANSGITEDQLPDRFKPMGAWSYFGHGLLFSIPVVGFILLIVYSAGGTKNINKRNYARSYFCGYAIAAVIVLIYILLLALGVGGAALSEYVNF